VPSEYLQKVSWRPRGTNGRSRRIEEKHTYQYVPTWKGLKGTPPAGGESDGPAKKELVSSPKASSGEGGTRNLVAKNLIKKNRQQMPKEGGGVLDEEERVQEEVAALYFSLRFGVRRGREEQNVGDFLFRISIKSRSDSGQGDSRGVKASRKGCAKRQRKPSLRNPPAVFNNFKGGIQLSPPKHGVECLKLHVGVEDETAGEEKRGPRRQNPKGNPKAEPDITRL